MTQNLRSAVVGVGKLGRFHCDKYFALQSQFLGLEFVGVYDLFEVTRAQVAQELSQVYQKPIRAFADLNEMINEVDIVTIATSSHSHFDLVEFFLKNKKHVLVEKPLSLGFEQGEKLVQMAQDQNVVLAVGHSERFSPGFQFAKSTLAGRLRSIQMVRHSPYVERVTDVSVVDDLMIHDLDLLSELCGEKFDIISSYGKKVRSSHLDFCDVMMKSRDGSICVFLSANRTFPNMTRTVRVVTDSMSMIIDLQHNTLERVSWDSGSSLSRVEPSMSLPKLDHLLLETREFLKQVLIGSSQYVSGRSVLPALKWRDGILNQCK